MSIKDTMTRFDERFGESKYRTSIKNFIAEEIKLALEGITPEESNDYEETGKTTSDLIYKDMGWNACLEKIEELKNNYLKLN